MKEGLKDHEIARLVNAVTNRMKSLHASSPQCTRGIISEVIVKELMKMDRRIDHIKDSAPYPFQIDEYGED